MKNPDLKFDLQHNPFSQEYQDIYYSQAGGLAESTHVFLEGNQLATRWQQQKCFTIGEIGFGTGLNFLNTWQLWKSHPQAPKQLHYLSCENTPLTAQDMQRALSPFTNLASQSSVLVERLPLPIPGFHRIYFADGNILLTLLYGNALDSLKKLTANFDAWFLDGFSPKKNPELWSPELFSQISRLTKAGGSIATFSAASIVRHGLGDVGFTVTKRKGFGKKREMLTGILSEKSPTRQNPKPWFNYSAPSHSQQTAIIIGGGLAGCSLAHALAIRGWQVQILEQHQGIASGASDGPHAVLFPHFSANLDAKSRFYWAGFNFTMQLLKHLRAKQHSIPGEQQGLLLIAQHVDEIARFKKILKTLELPKDDLKLLNSNQVETSTGFQIQHSALYFKPGCWLSNIQFCQALSQHPNIELVTNTNVSSFEYQDDHWKVLDAQRNAIAASPTLIIANAYEAKNFQLISKLPIEIVRGQSSLLPGKKNTGPTLPVFSYGGSAVYDPAFGWEIGATFERDNLSLDPSEQSHHHNLDLFKKTFLNWQQCSLPQTIKARVARRSCTIDRWPIVGPFSEQDHFMKSYADLHHGKIKTYPKPKHLPGLYLHLGHGAKGVLSCPLSSEHLAAHLNGEALPLDSEITNAMHPNRFYVKKLITKPR